ncbi:MAG: HypC/HybG/HupF family hydrogenase formation chaperone [Tannerella sp.]|jgi:hypothetical protein|nr:HypC/HybG/HupF family hydrogenase formation chaperone [Tannerella sp.]
MSWAIPGKAIEIDDSIPELKMAKADFSGIVMCTIVNIENRLICKRIRNCN